MSVVGLGRVVMNGSDLDAPSVSADTHNTRHFFCTAEDARLVPIPALSIRSKVRVQSLYSITSSARASSEGGIVSPIAFAAFTLISKSYFVA